MLKKLQRRAMALSIASLCLAQTACKTTSNARYGSDDDPEYSGHEYHAIELPKLTSDPSMLAFAHDLDCLEHHIERYGNVTAKMPDVWGQARLTQYRDEFEKTFAADVSGFKTVLNGSQSRSDQAFFANATALSFASQPKPPVIGSVTSNKSGSPKLSPTNETIYSIGEDKQTGNLTASNTILGIPAAAPSKPAAPTPPPLNPLALDEPAKLLTGVDNAIKQNPALLAKALGFDGAGGSIGLEPTEYLTQKKRYIDFLNQLRRENEGDDTADSPGYSLNLMRIPVSILPGKATTTGYGAEITMSLNPILGDDLLPTTFRNLVSNDLQKQLGLPITHVLSGSTDQKLLSESYRRQVIAAIVIGEFNKFASQKQTNKYQELLTIALKWDGMSSVEKQSFKDYYGILREKINNPKTKAFYDAVTENCFKNILPDQNYVERIDDIAGPGKTAINLTKELNNNEKQIIFDLFSESKQDLKNNDILINAKTGRLFEKNKETFSEIIKENINNSIYYNLDKLEAPSLPVPTLTIPSFTFASGLQNKVGVPNSELFEVYGLLELLTVIQNAQDAMGASIQRQNYAHLTDVQAFLQEELSAAYRFLAQPESKILWDNFCNQELVSNIRRRDFNQLLESRTRYRDQIKEITGSTSEVMKKRPSNEPGQFSVTAALAWCILVDSALLNDRLNKDMQDTASAKKVSLARAVDPLQYFLPAPPMEARQAFNEYVKMRWPIHVFALDPYVQEQNISDSLSTRREMQLALSIAFTNGQINARNLTKYTRRLEAEYETISLNRTQIGFSHGENTFGWRFYPRYQTPPTKSNVSDFVHNQLIGGPSRNSLLNDRQLEPGMRECVAVVMMPSFVPYVNVDTVSNWFPLTNPKHKALDHVQAMRLSRTVQTIKTEGTSVKDACKFRPGEFERLQNRVEQLEARLPTQTMKSQLPILNTLGGFEMFNNGTTDLAPELFGWYGAPGIDPEADTTSLFLVGDHFSPLRTQVIVGNQAIVPANQKLLSRQVMQISFPKGAYTVGTGENGEVRIHLATPYGVTRELSVPVVSRKPALKSGINVAVAKLAVRYAESTAPKAEQANAPKPASNAQGVAAAKPAKIYVANGFDSTKAKLELKWVGLDPTAISAQDFRVQFVFNIPGVNGKPATPSIVVPCGLGAKAKFSIDVAKDKLTPSNTGTLTIEEADLKLMMADLMRQASVQEIAATGQSFSLTTTSILVTARSVQIDINDKSKTVQFQRSILTNDQFSVTFAPGAQCQGCEFTPTPADEACPKADKPAASPKPNFKCIWDLINYYIKLGCEK